MPLNMIATFGIPLVTAIGYGLYCGYQHRCKINELRKQGVAMPKWNWLTGHLLVLQKFQDRMPPDANVQLALQDLCIEDWGHTEVFLMDFWPIYPPFYMIFDPQTATEVSNGWNLPKYPYHAEFMRPVAGGRSLVSMNGGEWKSWRSIFNPGFSPGHMLNLVPTVVDSVQVFCDKLLDTAKAGHVHQLDILTSRLTTDVILKVSLDMDSGNQISQHPVSRALQTILHWHSFWDPRILMNPLRPFIQKYYGARINTLLKQELEKRFAELRQSSAEKASHMSTKKAKSVIMLALEAYLADPELGRELNENGDGNITEKQHLDEHFALSVCHQIRLFLFAGSDTTSSTITFVYYLLSKHPDVLQQVREEHTRIFGPDPSEAGRLLKSDPTLLNQCPLTLAVMKETLRIYSPASTTRGGMEGASLTDRHGNVYPADYVGANILHHAIHHNPRIWPRVEEFLPQRWLVEPGHELYPVANAWRPFEQGPRNCIGQTLVYNEIRIVLIMTLRLFDISPAYEEWDVIKQQREGYLAKVYRSIKAESPTTVHGERVFASEKAGGHPAEGYPCRVQLAV